MASRPHATNFASQMIGTSDRSNDLTSLIFACRCFVAVYSADPGKGAFEHPHRTSRKFTSAEEFVFGLEHLLAFILSSGQLPSCADRIHSIVTAGRLHLSHDAA